MSNVLSGAQIDSVASFDDFGCNPTKSDYAVFTHGWQEFCEKDWAVKLRKCNIDSILCWISVSRWGYIIILILLKNFLRQYFLLFFNFLQIANRTIKTA